MKRVGFILILLLPVFGGRAEETGVPETYQKRVAAFRKILQKETSRPARIRKAVSFVNDPKSVYRLDAINFVGEVRAKEAVPALIEAAKDEDTREFSIHSLGEIRDARGIPVAIRYLSDPNQNVRGNAQHALNKITHRDFPYRFDADPDRRADAIRLIEQWWHENKASFRVREDNEEEIKEAEEAWRKYGLQYLKR